MFVAGEKKWSLRGPIRGLHLDETFLAARVERQDVVTRAVPVLRRHPADFARKIRALGLRERDELGLKCE